MAEITNDTRNVFPLSLSQQNIWDLERSFSDTSINNICTTIRIEGRVSFAALQKSVNLVLAADSSLRTRLAMHGSVPMQYHAPFAPEQFSVFDFSYTSREGIENWEAAITREIIPLIDSPLYRFILFRTGENSGGLLIKIHHIISDGWSQVLLCNRIGQTYLDILSGNEPELEPAPSYQLHVQEEQDYFASSAYQRDYSYWSEVLQQSGEPSVIKSVNSAAISPVGQRVSFRMPEVLNHAIYAFCVKNRVAPFAVFNMALAIYFKRIGGADRFTIGVPIFNRTNYTFKQTTGMFVSTLPFFNEIKDEWSLSEFNKHLTEQWYELLRHQRFPFSEIIKLSKEQHHEAERLFYIALSYQDSQILESKDASVLFSGRWHYSGYQAEHLCIHLSNMENHRRYSVDYDYLTQFFSKQDIHDLHTCLMNILQEALAYPDKPIHELSVLSSEERERVLYSFNQTAEPIHETNVYERFSQVVADHPTRAALICENERLTYRALDCSSVNICAAIRGICPGSGALIAVLLPRKPTLFCSMMGILRAGNAFLLLSPELPQKRIQEILTQSEAKLILSTKEVLGDLHFSIPTIDIAQLPFVVEDTELRDEASPDDLAYVVYTSGSTGTPKGVEITQKNLLNFVQAMSPIYGKGAVLSVCNIGFDAFILESACALLNGRTIVLPLDEDLESPQRLARLISGYAVGFLSITPSRLSAFLKHPDFLNSMRAMESIVCGGEAFPSELLQRLQLCTNARIYNQYGPSEATVGVSIKLLNQAKQITAGRPMQNCTLYILDDWMNPLPVGVYGNLYIGGLCVGRGYRNAPDLTADNFIDNPFEIGDRLYRTGDIACWTLDGEIVLGGRSDRQVKLRGLRVEPQEVSACIATHPKVKAAAACVLEHNGQEVLVAFYTSDSPIPEGELLAYAAAYLPRYMIPAMIQQLDEIPLTPSGKLDESRLPVPSSTKEHRCAPATHLQKKMLAIFSHILNRDDLSMESDYFLFGGNSLNAMETIGEIAEQIGISVRIADLYACRNVLRLSELLEHDSIEQDDTASNTPLRPAPMLAQYPLSPVQQGIYVQSHMDPTGFAYHMPGAFRLWKAPDYLRLQSAFRQLIAEDPIFRTSFVQTASGVVAQVSEQVPFDLPILTGASFEDVCAQFLRPFDFSCAPLLRAALWEEAEDLWILFIDTHHIIGDGLSTPVVMHRLDLFYQGKENGTTSLSYLDYAYDLETNAKSTPASQLDYWKEHLDELPEGLHLPCDFPRPHQFDFLGSQHVLALSSELSQACDAFCEDHDISSYMLFLAAFGLLLAKISGKEDLIIGAPVSGRLRAEVRDICGPFINTLPLRLRPTSKQPISDYLNSVRAEVTGMLDHQKTPLEEIVAMLNLPRTLSENPLYQVMFSQRPLDANGFSLAGAHMDYLPISTGTAKLDITLEAAKNGDIYSFYFDYATSLFEKETIAFYGRCLESILRSLTSCKGGKLCDISVLSPRDRIELWDGPNHLYTPYLNLPIHRIIENMTELQPDAVAVIFHGKATTRCELDHRACELANILMDAGAKPGDCIGLALSRCVDLFAAQLAILKVGAAYVPLLPSFPPQRLQYMLETAKASLVICDPQTRAKLPDDLPCPTVSTDVSASAYFEDVPVSGNDLVNVMFTSGSTGQPKGVMLKHSAVSNLFVSIRELLSLASGPILCTTNVVFDSFIGESLFPLAMGKVIALADEEEMMLPWKVSDIIQSTKAEIFQVTPARAQMCLSNDFFCEAAASLKLILLGGEVLTPQLLSKFHEVSQATTINMYGPTEATVYMTMIEVSPGLPITIGKPLHNSRIYVLDEDLRPVLPTACGELCLAGECLAAGYISRPDLTEKFFVPDPFFPGQLMYRSGDIGRLRLNGSYDFWGRRDAQVKLNGQRVELDEISGAMIESGFALGATTVPISKPDGAMELCAFYQPSPSAGPDNSNLLSYLRSVLPAYMVPSRILPLEAMPYTASSKIDLQALKKLAQATQTDSVSEPTTVLVSVAAATPAVKSPDVPSIPALQPIIPPASTAVPVQEATSDHALIDHGSASIEQVLGIWRDVLQREDLSPDISFFEQGGTSLAALSVLSRYFNEHMVLTLAQFYENPTARAQLALISGVVELPQSEDMAVPSPDAAQSPIVDSVSSTYPRMVPPLLFAPKSSLTTVLLTGVTGFLGAHLLRSLLDAGAEHIVCTMRDGNKARLFQVLSWYFGSTWVHEHAEKIEMIHGDIGKAEFGLSHAEYLELSRRVDSIYHSAADVRHYASDSGTFLKTNVTGVQTVLTLARDAGAQLYHMSTCSVSGERYTDCQREGIFTEKDFDIGQNWQDNLYVKSKFLAESILFDAVSEGYPVRIFRLGRLVGRASDGVFQQSPQNNAFYLLMRAIYALNTIPQSMADVTVDLTPIDYCADAVVALRDAPMTVYHIISPTPPTVEQTVRALLPDPSVVPDDSFAQLLLCDCARHQNEILSPLIDLWNRARQVPTTISVSNQLTLEQLSAQGFKRPIPSPNRLLRNFCFNPSLRVHRKDEKNGI